MWPILLAQESSGWQTLLQHLLIGLSNGALFALIALGYTMVYGIIGLINFAHGDLFMLGAFLALALVRWNMAGGEAVPAVLVLLGMFLIVPLFCAALNAAVERLVYRPLRSAPKLAPLVSAIGVSFIFMNLGMFWASRFGTGQGAAPVDFPAVLSNRNLLGDSDVKFTVENLVLLLIVAVTMVLLTLLVKFTRLGKAMRATAQDPVAAQLMGINVDRVIAATFAIGGALAGVASVVYGLYIKSVDYQMGYINGLFAFTAAVLGGIGNIPGAVLGGLLIGLIRSLGSGYLEERWTSALIFAMLIAILVFRPSGLLGAKNEGKSMKPPWQALLRPEAICLAVLLLYPLLPVDRHLAIGHPLTDIFIFSILALGLNLVVGYAGLLHLGIAAFFGIGAYLTGILTYELYPFQLNFWIALVLSVAGAALAGLVLSAPLMRLRGDYFALVTLGFGEVVRAALKNLDAITHGSRAISPIPAPQLPAFLANLLPAWRPDFRMFYYLCLFILVGVYLTLRNLERSRLGRAWVAIREDELAATCMGISAARVKLSALVWGSALAGLAGSLYATKLNSTAQPDSFDFSASIITLCCIILGGLASLRGTLLGVFLLKGFESILAPQLDLWLQGYDFGGSVFVSFSNWKLMVFGLALVLMMRFRPEGLLPSQRMRHELHQDSAPPTHSAAAPR